jgi:hypothetical protein
MVRANTLEHLQQVIHPYFFREYDKISFNRCLISFSIPIAIFIFSHTVAEDETLLKVW